MVNLTKELKNLKSKHKRQPLLAVLIKFKLINKPWHRILKMNKWKIKKKDKKLKLKSNSQKLISLRLYRTILLSGFLTRNLLLLLMFNRLKNRRFHLLYKIRRRSQLLFSLLVKWLSNQVLYKSWRKDNHRFITHIKKKSPMRSRI